MSILVTGGCGYIGAHVVRALVESGESVVVVDDLSTGIAERIAPLEPVVVDLAAPSARGALAELMTQHSVDAVIHLAALKHVADSVQHPTEYYRVNLDSLRNVIDAARESGVRNLVFSSSAAVYGSAAALVTEQSPTVPSNPYGETKLLGEWLMADAARAFGFAATSLRYFNVAGAATPELGDRAIANLVPMAFERIQSGHAPEQFGADYDTPDGSCVRDYIHVADLADAHLVALRALRAAEPGSHAVYNVGTGHGASVREMLDLILEVSASELEPVVVARRAGDPARVVADPSRMASELGWVATRSIREMIQSAWDSFAGNAGPASGQAARATKSR